MSLYNAQRALEIVDARLVATQARLAEADANEDPEGTNDVIEDIIDHLDLIIGDVRAVGGWVAEHECDPKTFEFHELAKQIEEIRERLDKYVKGFHSN